MKKILFIIALLIPIAIEAQTTPKKLAWNQDAASLAEASGFTYTFYMDSNTQGVSLAGINCSGTTTPFTCTSNLPLISGIHSFTFTAMNAQGIESAKSSPLSFSVPNTPVNPHIQ